MFCLAVPLSCSLLYVNLCNLIKSHMNNLTRDPLNRQPPPEGAPASPARCPALLRAAETDNTAGQVSPQTRQERIKLGIPAWVSKPGPGILNSTGEEMHWEISSIMCMGKLLTGLSYNV